MTDRSAAARKAWDKRGRRIRKAASAAYRAMQARRGKGGGAPAAGAAPEKTPAGKSPRLQRLAAAFRSGMGFRREKTTPTPPPPFKPDVEKDADGDGVTDAARVGVPAAVVPPPPKIPRLPNLTEAERTHENQFASDFEKDPDGMARQYIEMVKKGGKPNTFEADAAKNLYAEWSGKDGGTPEARAEFRATMNTALHQTANAVTKRAFLMHLDSLSDADKQKGLLVTVGGVGSGKGYALGEGAKSIPELDSTKYGAVWDSAGDQNATENPWLLKEAAKRGIKVTYAYVSADPEVSWADPTRGVVKRAQNPKDGRMVDAHVFADSYVLGAKNHDAFHRKHAKDATFLFLLNGKTIKTVDRVPAEDLKRDRKKLRSFATWTVRKGTGIPSRIKRGGQAGIRIWAGLD